MAAFFQINSRKVYKERRLPKASNYKQLYRFEEENVKWLSEHFCEPNCEKRGGALTSEQKMRTFLRYIGDPGFQVGVGEDIGVHQSTVCRTVEHIANNIKNKAHEWIKFPSNNEEHSRAKHEWQTKYRFPACIGALDCTHIEILKPTAHSEEYINRKGYASINVQATCNATECFTSVDCQWPGSVHDSRIWRNSTVEMFLRNSSGSFLLADEGYGISPWVMTPFKNPITPQEKLYNKLHAKERAVIERCFGQLKRRFPILQNCIRVSLRNVPTLVVACFVLHNIAKHLKDEDDFILLENNESEEDTSDNGEFPDNATEIRRRGQHRRNEIADLIFNSSNVQFNSL